MSEELFQNVGSEPDNSRPNRSDEDIQKDIETLITKEDYLKHDKIKVSVKDCNVTLEGVVYSPQSWEMAENLASGVSGVREIHNQIQVESGSEEP